MCPLLSAGEFESEYDANHHYRIGPRLAQPRWLRKLIDSALGRLVDREDANEIEGRTLAREVVELHGGDAWKAWRHIKATTNKRERRRLRLTQQAIYEARDWNARMAA